MGLEDRPDLLPAESTNSCVGQHLTKLHALVITTFNVATLQRRGTQEAAGKASLKKDRLCDYRQHSDTLSREPIVWEIMGNLKTSAFEMFHRICRG